MCACMRACVLLLPLRATCVIAEGFGVRLGDAVAAVLQQPGSDGGVPEEEGRVPAGVRVRVGAREGSGRE